MPGQLLRLFLALSIAFVFTGRIEAATDHCLRLAVSGPAASLEAAPCHGMANADGMMGMAMDGEAAPVKPMPAKHAPRDAACECLAMLVACDVIVPASEHKARIAPFRWMRPEPVAFASAAPSPDPRPPRA